MFSIWKLSMQKKDVNILLAHYLQCNRKNEHNPHKFEKTWTYLKCKSFCQSLATTKLPPPMKLQLVGQCKGTSSTNHNGETWKRTWWEYTTSWTLTITQWTSIKTWWTPTTGNNTMNTNNQQHDETIDYHIHLT
jgi:hypothetical protein